MIRLNSFALTSLVALTASAYAAPQLQRVRGTIQSATDTTVTVKTRDGRTQAVTLVAATKFVAVVKSSLSDVGDGKFIGTATKGEPPVALEVVVFPDSMRGTGEGHYPWDPVIGATSESGPVKSSMTNGTIKSSAKSLTKNAMTNGTIKSGASTGGGKTITVTYGNGKSLDISIPESAPIVAYEPADRSILKPGGTLYAVTAVDGDKLSGKLVAVGKDGVTPPM